LRSLRDEVTVGSHGDNWKLVDELVTIGNKVYIALMSPSLPTMLASEHGVRHEGMEKTLHHLHTDIYIEGARTAMQDHIRACVVYQQNKTEHLHSAVLNYKCNAHHPSSS
jgi:hypothetical protein